MKVFFFPEYSGYTYRELSDVCFNETVQGLNGLLSLLDLHRGKKSEEKSYMERVFSYKKAVGRYIDSNPDAIFSSSFSVDPFGTSERLLSWRDTLVSYGWKENKGKEPSRLFEALRGVEKFFNDESIWERIERIRDDVDKGALLPKNLEIIIPFSCDSFHPMVKSLLSSLQKRGVVIRVNERSERDESSDLSRVNAFLSGEKNDLDLNGDGSFEILSFSSTADAYRYIATEGYIDSVYIESHPDILDNWLKVENKPAVGSSISGLTEISQLPVLGLRLFKNPLNPEYLLSWLTTTSSPVPASLGSRLANEIVSSGGYFNKKCESIINDYLSRESEREEGDDYRERVVNAFLPKKEYYSYGDDTRREDVVNFIDAFMHYALTKQDNSGFAFIAKELSILLSYFDGDEREFIPYSEIEGLISLVSRPMSGIQYERERGSLSVVSSPFSFVSSPDSVIWNGLNEITGTQFSSSFLRPAEKEYASSLPYYWKEENEIIYNTLSSLIPFKYSKKRLEIVCVVDTKSIEDSLSNPFLIRVYEKVGEKEFMKIIKYPVLSEEKTREAELFSNDLGIANTYVTFSSTDKIKWPDHESYSTLSNLIHHPLDYFMSSILNLYPMGVAEMNKLSSTMGTVAHRVIELIFGKNENEESGTPGYIERVLGVSADAIIDDVIREKGAILLMDVNLNQTQIFKKDLKLCLYKLLDTIKNNHLSVVATESWFSGVDVGLSGHTPISGSADMVLENRDGQLYIFDFKWSNSFSFYKMTIENNTSIQLELYRKVLEETTKKEVVFASYVLLPSLSFFTKDELRGNKEIKISPERDLSLLDEIKASFEFRKNEISSGRIEIGDGHSLSDLEYSKDEEDKVPLDTDKDGNKLSNKFSDYECFKR